MAPPRVGSFRTLTRMWTEVGASTASVLPWSSFCSSVFREREHRGPEPAVRPSGRGAVISRRVLAERQAVFWGSRTFSGAIFGGRRTAGPRPRQVLEISTICGVVAPRGREPLGDFPDPDPVGHRHRPGICGVPSTKAKAQPHAVSRIAPAQTKRSPSVVDEQRAPPTPSRWWMHNLREVGSTRQPMVRKIRDRVRARSAAKQSSRGRVEP
jgi:hypothetical protein